MAKEPAHRFGTCRAFAAALTEGAPSQYRADDATQLATTVAASSPCAPGPTRRKSVFIAVGVAALLAVGLVGFTSARLGQTESLPVASPPSSTVEALASPPPHTVTYTQPPVVLTQQPAPVTVTAPPPGPRTATVR